MPNLHRSWAGALALALGSPFFLHAQTGPEAAGVKPVDSAGFVKEIKIAVLVGISDYDPDSGFPKLSYAAKDAQDLSNALKRQDYRTYLLTDEHAKRLNIRTALKHAIDDLSSVRSGRGNHGTVLFAFSGHGTERQGSGGAEADQFLVTADASADEEVPGISMKEIEDLLRQSGAARKMMFIDACRDLSVAPSKGAAPAMFRELAQSEGLKILYSTAPGHRSYEDDKAQNGVFTHYLLDALSGKSANPDGLITFDGLAKWVSSAMRSDPVRQTPYVNQGASGDFFIAGRLVKKAALVVGIDKYADRPLQGAVSGARAVADQLEEDGFTVDQLENATYSQLRAHVEAFAKDLRPQDVALIYFAGSGGIASGQFFVRPVDAKLPEAAVEGKWPRPPANSLTVRELMDVTKQNHNGPNVFLFDMGLARASAADTTDMVALKQTDTLVLFSCRPGREPERTAEGSIFSRTLVSLLGQPGMSAGYAASLIRSAIFEQSNEYAIDIPSQLKTRVYLTPAQ